AGEYSELGASFVGRLGGRHVYTLISLGWSSEHAVLPAVQFGSKGSLMVGLGLGLHMQVGSWSIDPEMLFRHMFFTDAEGAHLLTTLRVALAAPLSGNVRFVFGPSFNAFFDFDNQFPRFAYGWTISTHGYSVKLWPGAFAGIRF